MPEPRLLVDGLHFPEGPCFAPDGTLWWVEIEGGRLGCLAGTEVRFIEIGGRPNGAVFDDTGILWIADQGLNAVRRFDPTTGAHRIVADAVDDAPLGKPNDLCFDALGRLVFTCSNDARTEPVGYVCRMGSDGSVARIAGGLLFPNGIGFAPDGAMVVAETYLRRLVKGTSSLVAWAETSGWLGPDGFAFAEDGSVFVAIFGQGIVQRFAPGGAPMGEIALPGAKPTNVALDPSGRLGLVVTEVETGAVYAVETGARPFMYPGGAMNV
ncbi:MAG: SMP-30/gluconolactonase/LRE family protein [Pseudomonadota bacterium]